MKSLVITLVALCLVCAAVIILSPGIRDELHWRLASHRNHAKDYAGYLESCPAGRHVTEAEKLYDDKGWSEAKALNSVQSFENYRRKHPRGQYVAQVAGCIDDARWSLASRSNTGVSYQTYLRENPEGKHLAQAKQALQELDWKTAERSYTIASLEKYRKMYPEGTHTSEANLDISALRQAAKQNTRPLEGYVTAIDDPTRTVTIKTGMGDQEVLRLTDETTFQKGETKKSLGDVTLEDGVRIEYVNTADKRLLARKVLMAYTVANCSCGQGCPCPLSRGCKSARY